jgi:hypothetical protein
MLRGLEHPVGDRELGAAEGAVGRRLARAAAAGQHAVLTVRDPGRIED